MEYPEEKLLNGLKMTDDILSNITFADLIQTLRFRSAYIDENEARYWMKELIDERMEEANRLLEDNMDMIIMIAREGPLDSLGRLRYLLHNDERNEI